MLNLMMLVMGLAGSIVLTGQARRYAIRTHLIDRPNARSSHSVPTPRGGGIAIVVMFLLTLVFFAAVRQLETNVFLAFAGGGALVALIGYLDDRRDISARVRLPVHIIAAIWATAWIGGIPHLNLGFATIHWGWFGHIVSVVGIVWLLNLYNFMDGIDGIAASEAVFVANVGGLLLIAHGLETLGGIALILAAICAGFLFWNCPKAKIFMGDVGSGFLGYVFGVFMINCANHSGGSLCAWVLLLSVFIVDATVTLLRRLVRGEHVFEAHRSHAYQHAAAMSGSHLKVTLGVTAFNVGVLAPLALLIALFPGWGVPIVLCTLLVLAAAALWFGAGTDSPRPKPKRGGALRKSLATQANQLLAAE